LSNRTRNILIVVGVLAVMILSRRIFPLPAIPEISLAPERLIPGSGFPFTNSLLMTLVVDAVLLLLVLLGARRMNIVPRGLQNVLEMAVELLYGLGESIDRRNVRRFFTLAASIFFFVFFSNLLALIPGVGSIGVCTTHEAAIVNPAPEASPREPAAAGGSETKTEGTEGGQAAEAAGDNCGQDEAGHKLILVPFFRAPSADLNMTLALALIVFLSTQYFGFHDLGIGYLGKFFNFREGAIGFIVGIVEFISEFVRIISFMFRLFGNIFAGEVVLLVMAFLIPWLLPSIFYGYELFVAFIQAFIFAVLAMVFISLATEAHGGQHAEHGGPTHGERRSPDDHAERGGAKVYETQGV
jgi:F-type H+-transporting ATPase subunit a